MLMCSFTLSYYDTPTDHGGYFYWWYACINTLVYLHSSHTTLLLRKQRECTHFASRGKKLSLMQS